MTPLPIQSVWNTECKFILFPSNTTSNVQPLAQGIIKASRIISKKNLFADIISRTDENILTFEKECKKPIIIDAICGRNELGIHFQIATI